MSYYKLMIPKERKKNFLALNELDDIKRDHILKLLSEIEPKSFSVLESDKEFMSNNLNLDLNKINLLIDLIMELSMIHYSEFKSDTEEFLTILKQEFDKDKNDDIRPDDWSIYSDFWRKILTLNKGIGIISKATPLVLGKSQLFSGARVFTDMRPIFESDPSHLVKAAIVLHNLEIKYFDGNEVKRVYITMDGEDLINLKEVIERALIKEKSLEKFFEKNKFIIIKDIKEM